MAGGSCSAGLGLQQDSIPPCSPHSCKHKSADANDFPAGSRVAAEDDLEEKYSKKPWQLCRNRAQATAGLSYTPAPAQVCFGAAPSIRLSVCSPVPSVTVHLSACLPVCPLVCLPACLPICLSSYLPVCPPALSPVCLPAVPLSGCAAAARALQDPHCFSHPLCRPGGHSKSQQHSPFSCAASLTAWVCSNLQMVLGTNNPTAARRCSCTPFPKDMNFPTFPSQSAGQKVMCPSGRWWASQRQRWAQPALGGQLQQRVSPSLFPPR